MRTSFREVGVRIKVEGRGTLYFDQPMRDTVGSGCIVSPRSDPCFEFMLGWDYAKALRWASHMRWKIDVQQTVKEQMMAALMEGRNRLEEQG